MQAFAVPEITHHPDDLRFSPDGRLLAVQAFGQVAVVDTTSGAKWVVEPELAPMKRGTPKVGFTADGRGVVYYRYRSDQASVRVHDLATGTFRLLHQGQDIDTIAPRDDGRLVFAVAVPGAVASELIAWDPVTGEVKFRFARRRGYLRELSVSPCGDWVAGAEAYDILVWDITGGKLPARASWRYRGKVQGGRHTDILTVSRGGRYVAVGGRRSVLVWDVSTGDRAEVDADSHWEGRGVAFHPHRQLLAHTWNKGDAGEVAFWDPATRTEVRRFAWGVGPLNAVAFSPDGLKCAAAGKGKVVVWDVDL